MLRKLMLFCSCLFLLIPTVVSAEEDSNDVGKIDWKLDRIIGNDNDEERNKEKTELENQFPDLFKEETKEKILEVKEEEEALITELENELFSIDMDSNTFIEDIKKDLFSEEYEVSLANEREEKDSSKNALNTLAIGMVIGIGILISSGVYVLYRRLVNGGS